MPVAPRIVNDVAYAMRMNHEIHFAWLAQYLVRLGRWMIFFYRPKCSYRFMFFL